MSGYRGIPVGSCSGKIPTGPGVPPRCPNPAAYVIRIKDWDCNFGACEECVIPARKLYEIESIRTYHPQGA